MARILVIDDEPNIRTMIRLTLEHDGHSVAVAADGDEGLRVFANGADFDLVLLDQRMPALEGVTVLKQLRYHDPEARIVMITAYGTVELAVEAMKSGARDFLRKPFAAETLRGAVQAVLKDPTRATPVSTGSPFGVTFAMTTINGFRIAFRSGTGIDVGNDMGFPFSVTDPDGADTQCTVTLAPLTVELTLARLDRDAAPGGKRFWQALAEESLADYLFQNAAIPPKALLRVDELSTRLGHWVDSVRTSS